MKSYLNKIYRVSGVTYTGTGDADGDADLAAKKKLGVSKVVKYPKPQPLKELPLLSETPMQKREALFKQKLELCMVLFNFADPESDIRGKEIKRETLLELAEYGATPIGQKIFTEALMPDLVLMVRTNLFRTLPAQPEDFDPEEDEPAMEVSWPHLQVVYEFYLRFIVSAEVNGKVAKKYVDQEFIRSWIELLDAEDPRERDYSKTILHRMYGKFMSYRSFIRKTMSQVFYRFIYETGRHNGIGELLEILGSIINGFAIPLKKEHVNFLEKALIPLHKPKGIAMYHPQLNYCILQYAEKDPDTVMVIIKGLERFWPWNSATKQVLFLGELEEIMELCRGDHLDRVQDMVFSLIGKCLSSAHFQVIERTLYFLTSEQLSVHVMSPSRATYYLPYIIGPLIDLSAGHWNQTVEGLAQAALKNYMEADMNLYDRCSRDYKDKQAAVKSSRTDSDGKWDSLSSAAAAQGIKVAAAVL